MHEKKKNTTVILLQTSYLFQEPCNCFEGIIHKRGFPHHSRISHQAARNGCVPRKPHHDGLAGQTDRGERSGGEAGHNAGGDLWGPADRGSGHSGVLPGKVETFTKFCKRVHGM